MPLGELDRPRRRGEVALGGLPQHRPVAVTRDDDPGEGLAGDEGLLGDDDRRRDGERARVQGRLGHEAAGRRAVRLLDGQGVAGQGHRPTAEGVLAAVPQPLEGVRLRLDNGGERVPGRRLRFDVGHRGPVRGLGEHRPSGHRCGERPPGPADDVLADGEPELPRRELLLHRYDGGDDTLVVRYERVAGDAGPEVVARDPAHERAERPAVAGDVEAVPGGHVVGEQHRLSVDLRRDVSQSRLLLQRMADGAVHPPDLRDGEPHVATGWQPGRAGLPGTAQPCPEGGELPCGRSDVDRSDEILRRGRRHVEHPVDHLGAGTRAGDHREQAGVRVEPSLAPHAVDDGERTQQRRATGCRGDADGPLAAQCCAHGHREVDHQSQVPGEHRMVRDEGERGVDVGLFDGINRRQRRRCHRDHSLAVRLASRARRPRQQEARRLRERARTGRRRGAARRRHCACVDGLGDAGERAGYGVVRAEQFRRVGRQRRRVRMRRLGMRRSVVERADELGEGAVVPGPFTDLGGRREEGGPAADLRRAEPLGGEHLSTFEHLDLELTEPVDQGGPVLQRCPGELPRAGVEGGVGDEGEPCPARRPVDAVRQESPGERVGHGCSFVCRLVTPRRRRSRRPSADARSPWEP